MISFKKKKRFYFLKNVFTCISTCMYYIITFMHGQVLLFKFWREQKLPKLLVCLKHNVMQLSVGVVFLFDIYQAIKITMLACLTHYEFIQHFNAL